MRPGLEWGSLAGMLLLAAPAWGQQGAGSYKFGRVTSVAEGAVGVDVGSADGVRQWTRLEIIRSGRAVAVLKVSSLSTHEATATITSRPVPLRAGDYVRYLSSNAPAAGAPAPAVASGSARPGARDTTARPRARGAAAAPTRVPAPVAPVASGAAPAPAAPAPAASAPAASAPAASVPAARTPAAPAAAPSTPPAPAPTAAPPTPVPAAPPVPIAGARMARVSFVTTSSAYLNAGKSDGLIEGARVDVVRMGRTVGELKVSFVSSHQASCQIVSVVDSVMVGDSARYLPAASAAAPPPAVAARTGPAARPASQRSVRRSSTGTLRGRVGLYYLSVVQRDSFGGHFAQPSSDLRLSGSGLGGSPLGLALDVRTRRSVRALPGTTTSTTDQTRVYQAQVYWQAPGSPVRFTTGRQYAPGITSVGLLDGAAVEISQSGWDYGLFGGLQPDLIDLGFSGDISQLGGYVRRHNRPASLTRWSLTAGASGSYVTWHTNREFLYLQASYLTRRFSFYGVQEVDYYRPWRRVQGEQAVSPTSSFANLQLQLTGGLGLTAGFDNRRSVRLYHDVIDSTAAAVFDETFRRGVWTGLTVRTPRHFRASFDVRTNHDATTGTANTYTLALAVERLTSLGIGLRTRSTRYTTGPRDGWLNSVSLGLEPWGRGSVALTSGWRTEHDSTAAPALDIRWLSADMDVSLARSLFVILSAYRETGGLEAHDLVYAGLNYRF
ncbi:MAG TPA: hypothetical protein VKP10_08255 [Gemmatimonadales bacterium]|nr:hypothetical protein [Gemmatimonadales bacterium]